LLPARSRKPPARRKRTILIAVSVVVILVAAAGLWWLTHNKNSSTASAAPAELTREPDPPVVPPPAREPLRPAAGELPVGGSSLAASLEIIKRAAVGVGDLESTPSINPRVARWEVRFPPGATVETYGHQLDSLGIELGVIGGGDTISYAGDFGKPQPERRTAPGAAEHRAYLIWRSGALANLDAALLSRAKVSAAGRLVVHFLPPQLELDLMAEEREFAAPQDVAQVRRTAFAVVPDGDNFKFRVAEQEYFSGEVKKYSQKLPAGAKPKADTKAPTAKLP
jgi:hypothetical protein